MAAYVEFRGSSNEAFRYMALDESRPPRGAGNFVLVADPDGQKSLIYAGMADNLSDDWREIWQKAKNAYGDTQVFVRLAIARRAREDQQADIIAAHNPPLNRDLARKS